MNNLDYLKVYNYNYDYETAKIIVVVNDFMKDKEEFDTWNFEDICKLAIEIRQAWDDTPLEEMTEEENAYSQVFAQHYLEQKEF